MFASLRTMARRVAAVSKSSLHTSFLQSNKFTFRPMSTITLNNLSPIPGSFTRERILGRGRSSGLGKTAGRGQKGQNARSGRRSRVRYEGGQTMLWRRSPKRGFKNINRQPLDPLNVGKLVDYICQGRIDPTKTITLKDLLDANIIGRFKYGIKLLGEGVDKVARLPVPINIEVSHASAAVKEAIEAAGGSCKFVYFSKLGLRHHLKPGCLGHFVPGPSVPPPKKALRYEHQLVGKDGIAKAAQIRLARIVRKIRVR